MNAVVRHFKGPAAGPLAAAILILFAPLATGAPGVSTTVPAVDQAAQYRAEAPKTIIELQQFRQSESIAVRGPGERTGQATLTNLNPRTNAWFLLKLDWGGRGGSAAYHLENPKPREQNLHLDAAAPYGLRISDGIHNANCDLWSGDAPASLEEARRSALAYAPLCDGRLFLRNRVAGNFTNLERATEVLRDHVWGSETIIGFVRREFYSDHFREEGKAGRAPAPAATEPLHPDWPVPASLGSAGTDRPMSPTGLGIDLDQPAANLVAGRWYPARGIPGVYVSFLQPKDISPDILASYRNAVNGLDSVEAGAMAYLIAFDLAEFDLGFTLGTDHPRVDWSDRPGPVVRNRLPGPDGIGSVAPLVTNGIVSPALAPGVVATFTGGFKRQHGAFRYGAFAQRNHGSHYGFVEQGVVFSKLLPGLATLYVLDDGTINLKTWTSQDDDLLPRIRFARQNGVPLIEYDPTTKSSAPGSLVNQWGPGNWSGSADEKLRSLRAGACLQETAAKRFLVYGYFSTATPSAMARVFQAYRCRYAMHLDMNALEHTYLALYSRMGGKVTVEHLVQGMADLDKTSDDHRMIPRFLGFPDNRDFFYLTRREPMR